MSEYLTIRERVVQQFCRDASRMTGVNDVRRADLRGNEPAYDAAGGGADVLVWEGAERCVRILNGDYAQWALELGVTICLRPAESDPLSSAFLRSRWAGRALQAINNNPLVTETASGLNLAWQSTESGDSSVVEAELENGQTELLVIVSFVVFYQTNVADPTRYGTAIPAVNVASLPSPYNWTLRNGAGPKFVAPAPL